MKAKRSVADGGDDGADKVAEGRKGGKGSKAKSSVAGGGSSTKKKIGRPRKNQLPDAEFGREDDVQSAGGDQAGRGRRKSSGRGKSKRYTDSDDEDEEEDEEDSDADGQQDGSVTGDLQSDLAVWILSEWPGQSEGELIDLPHFWNVVSMMFPEEHSKEVHFFSPTRLETT